MVEILWVNIIDVFGWVYSKNFKYYHQILATSVFGFFFLFTKSLAKSLATYLTMIVMNSPKRGGVGLIIIYVLWFSYDYTIQTKHPVQKGSEL